MSYKLLQADTMQRYKGGAQRDTQEGKSRFDLYSPHCRERMGQLLRAGMKHYGAYNCFRGMPVSRLMASADRHYQKAQLGSDAEDHYSAAIFNYMCIVDMEERLRGGDLSYAKFFDCPPYRPIDSKRPDKPLADLLSEAHKRLDFRHRVYIAGPYTSPTDIGRHDNKVRATDAYLQLRSRGHLAFCPHAHTDHAHLLIGQEGFMAEDLSIVEGWATALFFLGNSPGADRELALAEKLDLTIWTCMADVPSIPRSWEPMLDPEVPDAPK